MARLMKRQSIWLNAGFAALSILTSLPLMAEPDTGNDGIYVLGALHGLHESEDSFTYDDLRAIITRLNPDIMVLEVRPDELAEFKDTRGRPEYPEVIWPMLRAGGRAAVAMEPGGEDFDRMTGRAAAAFKALNQENPAGAAFLRRYRKAFETALVSHWESPAQSHDQATADLVEGYKRVQFSFFDHTQSENQAEWDGYMADIALETARANPQKRILVLGSYRNRHVLEAIVQAGVPDRVRDMKAWLEQDNTAPSQ